MCVWSELSFPETASDVISAEKARIRLRLHPYFYIPHIDGLVQDCRNSSALTMELLQSSIKPSIYIWSLCNL